MTDRRVLGWVLLGFGLFGALMLVLVDMSLHQRAVLRALLAREGVVAVPTDVWVRSPNRTDQPQRVVAYRFEPRPGVEVEGADPVPALRLEAVLAGGRPEVLFLPDRPEINALAATVAASEAAGGVAGRRRGGAFWAVSLLVVGIGAAGVMLLRRRRPAPA